MATCLADDYAQDAGGLVQCERGLALYYRIPSWGSAAWAVIAFGFALLLLTVVTANWDV
ncbi:MAG: hypothetical protein K2X46_13720 [Roseomonas sp.]|nr:hypothetical protein [Roseomonas sp.]